MFVLETTARAPVSDWIALHQLRRPATGVLCGCAAARTVGLRRHDCGHGRCLRVDGISSYSFAGDSEHISMVNEQGLTIAWQVVRGPAVSCRICVKCHRKLFLISTCLGLLSARRTRSRTSRSTTRRGCIFAWLKFRIRDAGGQRDHHFCSNVLTAGFRKAGRDLRKRRERERPLEISCPLSNAAHIPAKFEMA